MTLSEWRQGGDAVSRDKILIVGGPHDGAGVPYHGPQMQMLVPSKESVLFIDLRMPQMATIEVATYVERIFRDNGASISIYTPANMTCVEAMRLLLRHYRPGADPDKAQDTQKDHTP